jgi:hypothetical protein
MREKPLVGIRRIETLELIVKDFSDTQLFGLEGMVETKETRHFFKSKLIEAVDQIDLRNRNIEGDALGRKGPARGVAGNVQNRIREVQITERACSGQVGKKGGLCSGRSEVYNRQQAATPHPCSSQQ